MLSKLLYFARTGIWKNPLKYFSGIRLFAVKYLRIIILATHEFNQDSCIYRASFLTFHTLLSIVPIAAVAFGIAKGFGLEKFVETQITNLLSGQQIIADFIINLSQKLLENTRGGIIAGAGIIILFFTVVSVLANIENSFNKIWGVRKPRNLTRKIADYISMMFLGIIFLILYSSGSVFVIKEFQYFTDKLTILGPLTPLITFIIKQIPNLVVIILFTTIYVLMPNTKTNLRSCLTGGIIAGIIYVIIGWIYIKFQVGVMIYGPLYGGFAALPLFLVWLYISWMIVLLGAEIAFANENVETFGLDPDYSRISIATRKILILRIMHLLAHNFSDELPPSSDIEISNKLEIPVRLIHQIINELVEIGIVSESINKQKNILTYQPGVNIHKLTIKYILDAVENHRGIYQPVSPCTTTDKLTESLKHFGEIINNSAANHTMTDI